MYDVIIVGAGPAGSTCARACAKQGLKTLLLDRDAFPRDKPCGGAVSEQALSHLDFPLPPEIIERECFGARVHFASRTVEVGKDCRLAVLVDRATFDQYLAEKAKEAGAEFKPDEAVVDIEARKDGVAVRTGNAEYRARYLIGADGANSLVGRKIRPLFPRDEIMAALVGHVPEDNGDIDRRLGGSLDLYFGAGPMGYGWVFPHDGRYNVGIMGVASDFGAPQKIFSEFAGSIGMNVTHTRGHTIPLGGIRRKIAGGRIILAGDAAGFADPFHGEGIAHAIHSGKLAAQAVVDRIIKKDREAFSRYEQQCERLIRKNLKIALRMARLLDKYPHAFLAIFFSDKKALDRYLDIPAGRTDYVRFRRWLLLRLPWYLLRRAFMSR